MYPVIRAKNRKQVLLQREYLKNNLEYLQFPKLAELASVDHLFSTRLGGVSKGHLSSLNFSFSRGDMPENVLENYRRIGHVLDCKESHFVTSQQTHTTNIRIVTEADAGKGVTRERDYEQVDGLITNVPGLVLTCFFADCVPLYFVDPVKHVIGLAHSGWRGTVSCMGARMVETMQRTYGCRPEDMIAAIGPSICQGCYEISEEVAEQFRQGFWAQEHLASVIEEVKAVGSYGRGELLISGKEPGKYQLDLWLANLLVLRSAGIPFENIDMTDICTCCNPEYLYSHRASNGLRGNLAAFLKLNKL